MSEPQPPVSVPPVNVPHPRAVRSFVRRAGRVTSGQARAYAAWGEHYLLPFAQAPLDVEQAFGRAAPLVLEIGFGMGEATAHIAALLPHLNFLGCEVHDPGVGALLKRIGVLQHMLPPASLHGVHIFFPDPWHKKRHHKRRLIQPPLVHELALRLQPGGYIHCATDWQPYAEQMLQVLSAEPLLANTATAAEGYVARPHYRPLTKFEQRGLRLGHGVWDLVFTRKGGSGDVAQ